MTNCTPFPAESRWTAIVRSSHACTYGQWLHQDATARTGLSQNEAREYVFPSTAGREKSGAAEPIGSPSYFTSSTYSPGLTHPCGRSRLSPPSSGCEMYQRRRCSTFRQLQDANFIIDPPDGAFP